MKNIKEIKIIIRKHNFTQIPIGAKYEVGKHGITECNIGLPSTRLDRISNMIYSTKFKDGSDGPMLCGFVENEIFYVIGLFYPDETGNRTNWNPETQGFYNVFNLLRIAKKLSKLDLTSFDNVLNPRAVLAIKMTV